MTVVDAHVALKLGSLELYGFETSTVERSALEELDRMVLDFGNKNGMVVEGVVLWLFAFAKALSSVCYFEV